MCKLKSTTKANKRVAASIICRTSLTALTVPGRVKMSSSISVISYAIKDSFRSIKPIAYEISVDCFILNTTYDSAFLALNTSPESLTMVS